MFSSPVLVLESRRQVDANRELPVAKNFDENLQDDQNQGHSATFAKYLTRLLALVQQRMSARLAARIDADDVVMSAYRSFFLGMREGRLTAESSQDIWHLLVEMTLHKLYRQVAYHSAQKRAVARESAAEELTNAHTREPSPESAAILADELAYLFSKLAGRERQVFELRLQGLELAEIADRVQLSERTVRRALDAIKTLLNQRFRESLPPTTNPNTKPQPRNQSPRTAVAKSVDVTRLDFRDYHLHEQIGAGSFAKVYRAERLSDGSTVAVKFLRKTWLRNKSAVARFAAEAQILTSLTHPHIAAISGWGRTPNQGYFLALQFAPGGDLQQRYRDIRPSWQQAVAYLSQVSSAVAFAHDHGIVHGDLKPGNVLLTAADNALVTDFGLAVPFAETRRSQVLTGTPAYLAPELLHSLATVASDVFGLGATLFFLLSGRSPYRGATLGEMLTDLSSRRRLQLPADVRDSLPPKLTAFCERCLRREPSERFANVAAVANELAALSHT